MTMKIEIDMTPHAEAVWVYQTAKANLEDAKKQVTHTELLARNARSALETAQSKLEKASADLSARFAAEAVPKMSEAKAAAVEIAAPKPEVDR